MDPVRVFISYSHKDEPLLNLLRDHLSPLRSEGLIADWYDRQITPGDQWDGEIREQLHGCQLVLLLLSASFFASDYIAGAEMTLALQRHAAGDARVIPIVLRPVDWEQSALGGLQALPTNGKPVTNWKDRHQAFRDVARGVRVALTRFASVRPTPSQAIAHTDQGSGYFLNHTSFLRKDRQEEFRERTGIPLNHYDIRVVLDAEEPDMLKAVARVEYILHPAYREQIRIRTADRDRKTKFLLKELANGEYLLRAAVYFVDDRAPVLLERYITLWHSGPELP